MPTQYGELKNGLRAYITYTLTTTATTYTLTITNAGIMAPAPIANNISLPAGDYTLSVRPYPQDTYVDEETLYRSAHTFAKGNTDRWQQVFTSDTLLTKSYSGTLNKTAYGGGNSEVGVSIRIRRDTSPVYQTLASIPIPTKAKYTVSYNANGGTGAPAQQTKWHGENITLQAGIPTRANYTFMGWATSASGSVAYQPSAIYTANSPIELYAVWKPFEYAVTYNANGGTGAPAQQTKYYGADLTLSAVIPIRAGYTFLGWATSQGGAVAYQPSAIYTANSPIELYAVWEAYYTYTINTMRVNASGDIIEDPNGEYIYIKANLTTEDYTNNPLTAYHFKDNGATATVGWYKNSDKTDSVTFPYQPAANNFILYAWYHADTEKHEVSFQFDTSHTTGKVISVIVPPIFRTMDFLAGGKGVAIGKRATQEGFDVEMNTVFRNEIKCSEINGNIKNIYDVFYPVGSYYETSLTSAIPSGQSTPTSTDLENLGVTWFDPNTAWGGTWVKMAHNTLLTSITYRPNGNTTDIGNITIPVDGYYMFIVSWSNGKPLFAGLSTTTQNSPTQVIYDGTDSGGEYNVVMYMTAGTNKVWVRAQSASANNTFYVYKVNYLNDNVNRWHRTA